MMPNGHVIGTQTELWFEPIQHAPDHLLLFTNPEQWVKARTGLTGVRLYVQDIVSYQFPDLIRIGAFKALKDMGLKFSIETGVIKPWLCDGRRMAEERLLPAIDAIFRSGGSVDKIVVEEPIYDGTVRPGCGHSVPQAADQVVAWVAALRAHYPDIPICDAEPYPALSASQLMEWINALAARGFSPQTFYLDTDMAWVAVHGVPIAHDLQALVGVLSQHGIRFATYLTENAHWGFLTDEQFASGTFAYLDLVKAAIGIPPELVLASWRDAPPQPSRNLPETTLWTFTNILTQLEAKLAPAVDTEVAARLTRLEDRVTRLEQR